MSSPYIYSTQLDMSDVLTAVSGSEFGVSEQSVLTTVSGSDFIAKKSVGVMHFYANGTSGSDSNSGLDEAHPKLTLQAVFDLVPEFVTSNVCVHLTGTFSEFGSVYLSRYVNSKSVLVVDGGDGTTTLAGPYTADIHSTTSIGLAAAGWSVDAYKGYVVEITSGDCAGQKRMIQGNTATTITPTSNFTADPGHATFKISRPTTTLSASSTSSIFTVSSVGGTIGGTATIQVQRLYMTGSKVRVQAHGSAGNVTFSYIISDSSDSYAFRSSHSLHTRFTYQTLSLSTFAVDTNVPIGISSRSSSALVTSQGTNEVFFADCFIYYLEVNKTNRVSIYYGSRFHTITLRSVYCDIYSDTNHALTKIDSSGNRGILVYDESWIENFDYVEISNHTVDGVYLVRSTARPWTSNLSGSSNGKYGMNADVGSRILPVAGITPTLAGGWADLHAMPSHSQSWNGVKLGAVLYDSSYDTLVKVF